MMRAVQRVLLTAAVSSFGWIGGTSLGQQPPAEPDSVLPGRPDATISPDATHNELLGKPFESQAAGIAFNAPADCKEIRPKAGGDDIVSYVNDEKRWALKVVRLVFDKPIAMTYHKQDPNHADSPDVNGLFQETIDRLKNDASGIQLMRQEITPMGPLDVGLIYGRYNVGTESNLVMIALLRERPENGARDASLVYYTFNFNATVPSTTDFDSDPKVRRAVQTFNALLDTVKVLDQTAIREDQNRRLFRTRTLLVSLTEARLRSALVPEAWLRVIKDGKDIGYTYVVEETGRDLPRRGQDRQALQASGGPDGVLIGMRSRSVPEAGKQIDSESWMWSSFDRRHEKFTAFGIIATKGPDKPQSFSEIGWADAITKLVHDDSLLPGEEKIGKDGEGVDRGQPAVRPVDVMTLNVNYKAQLAAEPVYRELPPWYMPQAGGYLLPRLLAQMSPGKTYLFATYNSNTHEVMSRYIDVGQDSTVMINGQHLRAIPVKDRIGLEGSVTTHYISPEGRYVGSVNDDQKMTIVPTDATTLAGIWKDANLTRPSEVEEKR